MTSQAKLVLPLLFATVSLLYICAAVEEDDEDSTPSYEYSLSNGWGDYIDWVHWNDARELAAVENKPIMLLIHKSWCGACKALKSKFRQSSAQKLLLERSHEFIMTNTADDEEPWEEEYQPDGRYIPRILFLDSNSRLLKDVVNSKWTSGDEYKYYYTSPGEVAASMKRALDVFHSPKGPVDDEQDKETKEDKKDVKVEKKEETKKDKEEKEKKSSEDKKKKDDKETREQKKTADEKKKSKDQQEEPKKEKAAGSEKQEKKDKKEKAKESQKKDKKKSDKPGKKEL